LITTTFLEISDPSDLRPPNEPGADFPEIHLKKVDCPIACSSMYLEVGKSQYWEIYRIGWTNLHWRRYLQREDIEISFIYGKDGVQIGYLELQVRPDASVEIVNFGLRSAFIGKGFGRSALTLAIRRGFELGEARLWLHTCTLDHPSALKNYYARGFRFVREEVTNFLPLDANPEVADHGMACT
jgi:ribosomal protein S18 acetylase RimI-like enzyme